MDILEGLLGLGEAEVPLDEFPTQCVFCECLELAPLVTTSLIRGESDRTCGGTRVPSRPRLFPSLDLDRVPTLH